MRDLDRVDPGVVEGGHDAAQVIRGDPVPDRVHPVAQGHVLNVDLCR
jgi:hypothetical protein